MQKKHVALLALIVIVLVSLFFFSSWTNARVVENPQATDSAGLLFLSSTAAFIIGVFIVLALVVLVIISTD